MITEKDIGKRVVVNGTDDHVMVFHEETGTIIEVLDGDDSIGIEFDLSDPYYHNCDGKCPTNRGYYVTADMVSIIEDDKYASLKKVLKDAEEQSSKGKGLERHANDNNFEDQVICVVGRLLKDHPFGAHAYQVIKKTIEAGRLYKIKGPEAAYREMLGAMVYCAAMNILIKEGKDEG